MKLKLDENLGHRTLTILHGADHDVTTVAQQNISGISDLELIDLCMRESRAGALVTLDLDFANPLLFKPSNYAGIAVLRLPSPLIQTHLLSAIMTLASALETEQLNGHLWIVEIGRIRVYLPERE
jgi:predicted nuclease of predicted toxin-antitoxin system